jgi:hypothetical protein
MALVIETLGNGVNINGVVQSTGNWVVEEDGKGGVNINNKGGGIVYKGPLSDVSVNGVTFSNYTAFVTAVSTVLFKAGGSGPGTEVSWDDVTDKPLKELATPLSDSEGLVPVYTQNGQLPVGVPEFPENAVPLALLDTKVPNGGTNGQVLKKDASGNNVWSADVNTTYTVITVTEFNTGTASTARAVSAASLNRDINAKLDLRLSAAQRLAIDALVSPTEDYADMTEATAAIKSIIDALNAS